MRLSEVQSGSEVADGVAAVEVSANFEEEEVGEVDAAATAAAATAVEKSSARLIK